MYRLDRGAALPGGLAFTAVVIFALVVIVVKAQFNRLVRPTFLEEKGATLTLEELAVAS
jgi:hypothetical protein